jgi:hypothetical protein
MSANPLDVLTAHVGTRELAAIESTFRPERRKRARTQVHWPVLLLRNHGAEAIETVTQNLSSNGFYCLSPEPLKPGESLLCTLKLPAFDPRGEERTLALQCTVVVMRAESSADGYFGLACRIEDYHLVRSAMRKS